MGQPPIYFHGRGRAGKPGYDGRGRGVKQAWEVLGQMSAAAAGAEPEEGGEPELDARCFV